MTKPKILVTTAAGKTGSATAIQLLEQGYPVRAMVRTTDRRSETLRHLGAEICVGNLDDMVDVRKAMNGVQRAYFNPPFKPGMLAASMNFAAAAQECKLEVVTVMSQWLADPTSPAKMTRDTWLTDKMFSWMPNVATVTVNPGWFADNYLAGGLDIIAQTGMFMYPLGEGQNAPPSNEDMARVIVGTLANPAPHLGKTYRPTGPRLLSPPQIAETFGKVLGRTVRYQDVPIWMMSKVTRAYRIPDYQTAVLLTYCEDYKRNAFGIGAPTNAVLEVSGQKPEDFETTARRYFDTAPNTKPSVRGFSHMLVSMMKVMFAPAMNLEKFNRDHDLPQIRNARLALDSPDWRQTHIDSTAASLVGASQ